MVKRLIISYCFWGVNVIVMLLFVLSGFNFDAQFWIQDQKELSGDETEKRTLITYVTCNLVTRGTCFALVRF